MKKTYEAPSVEKIAFRYRDQVVVASGGTYTCRIETTHNWNQNLQASKDDLTCHTGCFDSYVGDQHYQ